VLSRPQERELPKLLLFDIDGVLVDPRGYLRALQDTVAHFTGAMGTGELPPSEDQVRAFEAHGITSEWDSGAICLAYVLLQRLRTEPPGSLEADWEIALQALAAAPCPLAPPDYSSLAARVGAHIASCTGVAEAARALLWQDVLSGDELAPLLSALAQLLEQLLGHTYDFHRCPTTRHFQHLVLGAQGVRDAYQVEPQSEADSYLELYDTPLLEEESRLRLCEVARSGTVRAALYTARPSLVPAELGMSAPGSTPEAETARSLLHLEAFPILGLGSLRWLAARTNLVVEHLVKPSPVQALAAIGLAACGEQKPALDAAYALHFEGSLQSPLADLDGSAVYVFEDAPSGLTAASRAADLLQHAGISAQLLPHGIAAGAGPKRAALQAQGVPTYASVNDALAAALDRIGEA
jgi:hypothetical protein